MMTTATSTDFAVKQITRAIGNVDRRLRIVENREVPSGGGTPGGITEAEADLRYVNETGDSMTGALTISGNNVGRSSDANNVLEWRTTGFYVPTIDLSSYATDADLAAHAAAADPHPVYATDADLAAHTAAANPHPVYLTQAEADALYSVLAHTHDLYATDADLAAHVAAADPHPTYLTQAEADALYSVLTHTHDIYATDADLAAHAAAANPHPVYLTQAEGEGLFLPLAHQPGTDPHPQYATDTDLANHVADANPHPVYATDADLTAHVAAADPHPGYILESLLDAKGDLISATADNTPARLPVGTNGQFLTAQSGQTTGLQWVANPITAHEAAGDPHPQYATDTDLANHVAAADPHPVYATDADLAAHAAAANPHPVYLTQAEGDALYAIIAHNHDGSYSPLAHNHDAAYVNTTGDAMTGALTIQGKTVGASASAGNSLVWNTDGFFVAAGSIPISPDAGNILTMRANGLYVPMGLLFGRP
jgi:hypothetical protein